MIIKLLDHSREVMDAAQSQIIKGLEAAGIQAEGDVMTTIQQENISPGTYGYGDLAQSIHHKVVSGENAVYVGSNSDHAIYVEMGTGIHATGGSSAKKIPWVYPVEGRDGKTHFYMTSGMRARPYLKPTIEQYAEDYFDIIEEMLRT